MDLIDLSIVGASAWAIILFLPWRPWAISEVLESPSDPTRGDFDDITVLIPARNEAGVIAATLTGVKAQAADLCVVLVDDRSTDGTALVAQSVGLKQLRIVRGAPVPEGWSGKLWALEQGLQHVQTDLILLLDADIELNPGILQALRQKLAEDDRHLVSLMATLRMVGFWERAFMPAFVYFFKMLYPFRLSNGRFPWVAAAAGGCVLLKREALTASGGFKAVRNELIDDCALASQIKRAGGRTWIGLSRSVHSLRAYEGLRSIRDMVARTAFHQLRYSMLLLLLCTVAMITIFWLPVVGLFTPSTASRLISFGALTAMALSYSPVLLFYRRSLGWALLLPFIATGYLAMTWISAVRVWQGKGANWKGRAYRTRQVS